MYITNTTNEFTMGSSHVVFLNIFFYGDVTQKRHWQKNLPVGFNGLMKGFDSGIESSSWSMPVATTQYPSILQLKKWYFM